MQFLTLALGFLATTALALPAADPSPAIAVPMDVENVSAASALFHCSGSEFVACAKAAGHTAGICGKAIAKEGKNIIDDAKCAKEIYDDYKQHKFAPCKKCF